MKTKEQIINELKRREELKAVTYSDYRRNVTVMNTLKWVLKLPSKTNGHKNDLKKKFNGDK